MFENASPSFGIQKGPVVNMGSDMKNQLKYNLQR